MGDVPLMKVLDRGRHLPPNQRGESSFARFGGTALQKKELKRALNKLRAALGLIADMDDVSGINLAMLLQLQHVAKLAQAKVSAPTESTTNTGNFAL